MRRTMRVLRKEDVRKTVKIMCKTAEHPGPASEGHAVQPTLCGIVGRADAAVVQEPAERVPALEHVIHRFAQVGVIRHRVTFLAHPGFQAGS